MIPFLLLGLPLITIKLVIGLMEVEDQIKLSMTCSKIEKFIDLIKYNVFYFDIHLKNEEPSFDIGRSKQDKCDVRFNRVDGEVFDTKYFIYWYKDKSERVLDLKSINPLEDAMNFSKRLRSFFKIQFFHWKLHLDKLTKDEIMYVLPIIISRKCNMITILNGNIDSDLLSHIINTMPPEIQLGVDSDIPSDFKHEKAFSFYCSEYKNGLWVTIEDLLPIRDRLIIKLESTNFDYNDLNRFLCYWANCEHDMMQYLFVTMKDGAEDTKNGLFRQLTTLHCLGEKIPTYYILSQKDEDTKRLLGRIRFLEKSIEFSTWTKADYGDSYVLPVLKIVHRQNQLIAKYAEIKNEESRCQNEWAQTIRGSTESENIEEELARLRIIKEEMETEFDENIRKLESEEMQVVVQSIHPN